MSFGKTDLIKTLIALKSAKGPEQWKKAGWLKTFRKKSKLEYCKCIFRNNVDPLQVSKNAQSTVLMNEVALWIVRLKGEISETMWEIDLKSLTLYWLEKKPPENLGFWKKRYEWNLLFNYGWKDEWFASM